MDRGAWQATVYGVSRVGHDLVTKQQQQDIICCPSEIQNLKG